MQNSRPACESRSPQSLLRDLRRSSARAERTVALALFLSTCTLIFSIVRGSAVLAQSAGLFA